MATLIDAFNDSMQYFVSRCVSRKPILGTTQLLWFHIVNEWNRLGRPNSFRLSDSQLGLRCGGYSKQTITDAKRILKNIGFIDYKTQRQGVVTEYSIKIFSAKSQVGKLTCATQGNSLGNSAGNPECVCFAPTPDAEDKENAEKREIGGRGGAPAQANDSLTKVYKTWREYNGRSLIDAEVKEFERWLADLGENRLLEIIPRAWDKCEGDRMTFNYIRAFVEREIEPSKADKRPHTPDLKIVKFEEDSNDSDFTFQPSARSQHFGF